MAGQGTECWQDFPPNADQQERTCEVRMTAPAQPMSGLAAPDTGGEAA